MILAWETFDGWYEITLKRRRKAVRIAITRHLNSSDNWINVAVLEDVGFIAAKNAALRAVTRHERARVIAWGRLRNLHTAPTLPN